MQQSKLGYLAVTIKLQPSFFSHSYPSLERNLLVSPHPPCSMEATVTLVKHWMLGLLQVN